MIKKITAFIFSILLLITSVCAVCADNDDLPILPIIKFSQGDVNRDSKVNIKDATQIQKYLALIVELDTQQQVFADVDGKKGITIKDVTHIQKRLAGRDTLSNYPAALEEEVSDFNGDGRVSIKDATAIQKHLVGLI